MTQASDAVAPSRRAYALEAAAVLLAATVLVCVLFWDMLTGESDDPGF